MSNLGSILAQLAPYARHWSILQNLGTHSTICLEQPEEAEAK